jgi:hypothetical protein
MMFTPKTLPKIIVACSTALLIILVASACSASQKNPTSAPGGAADLVTQVVTREVTQEVKQEVTRIVEVPVTVTPEPTLAPTPTPDPSMTGLPGLPLASLPEYTDCLYGPASWYAYKSSFQTGQQVEVVGRSQDAAWINIEEVGGWNSCWIQAGQAQLQSGRVDDLPLVNTMLPKSVLEFGSPSAIARRNGDDVTVSWKAIYMSPDEIQGYLIEAEVCQGGQHIQLPVFVGMTFDENVDTISVQIEDEAGCMELSTAHIVSVGKRGFAEWEKIFWPPY